MGWDAREPAGQGCASGAGMALLHPDTGVPARVRVQGGSPVPFVMSRLVRGCPRHGGGACLAQGAVFLGA